MQYFTCQVRVIGRTQTPISPCIGPTADSDSGILPELIGAPMDETWLEHTTFPPCPRILTQNRARGSNTGRQTGVTGLGRNHVPLLPAMQSGLTLEAPRAAWSLLVPYLQLETQGRPAPKPNIVCHESMMPPCKPSTDCSSDPRFSRGDVSSQLLPQNAHRGIRGVSLNRWPCLARALERLSSHLSTEMGIDSFWALHLQGWRSAGRARPPCGHRALDRLWSMAGHAASW